MMSSFIAIMAAVSLTACGKEEPIVYSTSQQYTLSAGASACSAAASSSNSGYMAYPVNGIKGPGSVFVPEFNTEEYNVIGESVFKDVSISPLSTFSADVDTASYSNIRRMIKDGRRNFPEGAVRAEEMINYFDYNYQGPQSDREPFGVNSEISTCPWNEEHKLIQIGLQTEEIDYSET
ncbi:MAG: von Willebrand factor type A domain-containing protein, partial [Lachnospiraceae bacterium]|nr:von Willebrand factor type A domain-containing protein [Lachnospiraceae bacterium]